MVFHRPHKKTGSHGRGGGVLSSVQNGIVVVGRRGDQNFEKQAFKRELKKPLSDGGSHTSLRHKGEVEKWGRGSLLGHGPRKFQGPEKNELLVGKRQKNRNNERGGGAKKKAIGWTKGKVWVFCGKEKGRLCRAANNGIRGARVRHGKEEGGNMCSRDFAARRTGESPPDATGPDEGLWLDQKKKTEREDYPRGTLGKSPRQKADVRTKRDEMGRDRM